MAVGGRSSSSEARVVEALAAAAGGSCRVVEEDVAGEGGGGAGSSSSTLTPEDAFLFTFSQPPQAAARRGAHFERPAASQPVVVRQLLLSCLSRTSEGVVVGGGEGVGLLAAPAPGAGAQPASFTVTLPATLPSRAGAPPRPHGFAISPLSGSLAPGESVPLVLSFTTEAAAAAAAGGGSSGEEGLRYPGEWQEVKASVLLKGGAVVPGAKEEKAVTVILRGFMPGSGESGEE